MNSERPGSRIAYRTVREDIRDKILSGVWGPGDLLPNEVVLAKEFDCARATVNRAMRELAQDGLLERKRKAGTRVRRAPLRQARFDIPIVRHEIEARGAVYRYALIAREILPVPGWLRARLNLPDGGEVLHLTCLHFADDSPYQYEDRWINLAALPQAKTTGFETRGPNEWLIETVPFSDAEISFSASPADAEHAQRLRCAKEDALFLMERATWWQDQAITYVKMYFQRGHRITTKY